MPDIKNVDVATLFFSERIGKRFQSVKMRSPRDMFEGTKCWKMAGDSRLRMGKDSHQGRPIRFVNRPVYTRTRHKDVLMHCFYSVRCLIASTALFSCSIHAAPALPPTQDLGVIRTAEAFTYKQMLAQGIKPLAYPDSCCSLLHGPGTPESEYKFNLDQAYFIRVYVDAAKFAPELFRMSCQNRGLFNPTTECSQEELKEKVSQALVADYPGALYGKYRARWIAIKDGERLPGTEKWLEQDIHSFKRQDGVDEIVIGPIIRLPTTMRLSDFDEVPVTPSASK